MNRFLSFIIALLVVALLTMPSRAVAQADDLQDNPDLIEIKDTNETSVDEPSGGTSSGTSVDGVPPGFTGTLSADDPDSPLHEEEKLFGKDEVTDEEPEDDFGPSHLMKFEFDSQVLITAVDNPDEIGSPYMEINYSIKFEQEIEIKTRRYRTKTTAEIIPDIVGDLASNELFSCKLEILFDDLEEDNVEIMIKHNIAEETEEEPAKSDLAIQIKFTLSNLLERWKSNCLASDGSVLNTEGDKEKFLSVTLEEVQPSLNGTVSEDYNKDDTATMDINAEPFIIEDEIEEFLIQGSGQITVEPLD